MSPAEALEMLQKVAENYHGTKADHDLLSSAVSVLADFIARKGDTDGQQQSN